MATSSNAEKGKTDTCVKVTSKRDDHAEKIVINRNVRFEIHNNNAYSMPALMFKLPVAEL